MPRSRPLLASFLAPALAAALLTPLASRAQPAAATERLTLVVEILERDDTPVPACGILGPTPRDVTARVVRVEEGAFPSERILLAWPVCAIASLEVGARHRIQIRRFVDRPAEAATRYRVRRSWPIGS